MLLMLLHLAHFAVRAGAAVLADVTQAGVVDVLRAVERSLR